MCLNVVDGWINPSGERVGRYVNEKGFGMSGFYRRDYKKHCNMLVLENGHRLIKYKYPRVSIPFSSQMSRWQNLYFCGGYSLTKENGSETDCDELLFDAVASRLKPIGFIITDNDSVNKMAAEATSKGLMYSINPHFWQGHSELAIANRGRIKDHFDIDRLIQSYRIMENSLRIEILSISDEEHLRDVSEKQLSDFLRDYDYVNPRNDFECILTGLLLGFPIESTVAFITEDITFRY